MTERAEQDKRARDERVDELLHDAARALDGSALARRLGDAGPARSLASKAGKLFVDAIVADPWKEAPAWAEVFR